MKHNRAVRLDGCSPIDDFDSDSCGVALYYLIPSLSFGGLTVDVSKFAFAQPMCQLTAAIDDRDDHRLPFHGKVPSTCVRPVASHVFVGSEMMVPCTLYLWMGWDMGEERMNNKEGEKGIGNREYLSNVLKLMMYDLCMTYMILVRQ